MSQAIAWDELDRRADAVAGRLRDLGVSRGSVVALDGAASIETAAAILGIVRAGAVAAPLPVGRTAPETAAALALLDPVLHLGRDEPVRDGRTLDAPGVVVLTSGTTAAPKGVVLSVDALDASAAAWLAALPPASGWLLALGLAHVAGIGVLWRAASGRVPVRIVPPDDPAAQLGALTDDPAMSHVSLVPAQLARLLDAAAAVAPPPSLRAVLLGGGTIPSALVTRALDAGWPVVPTYGLSEAGSGVTALATADGARPPAAPARRSPASPSRSRTRARTASARSSSTRPHASRATWASLPTMARSGPATSAAWTTPGGSPWSIAAPT